MIDLETVLSTFVGVLGALYAWTLLRFTWAILWRLVADLLESRGGSKITQSAEALAKSERYDPWDTKPRS